MEDVLPVASGKASRRIGSERGAWTIAPSRRVEPLEVRIDRLEHLAIDASAVRANEAAPRDAQIRRLIVVGIHLHLVESASESEVLESADVCIGHEERIFSGILLHDLHAVVGNEIRLAAKDNGASQPVLAAREYETRRHPLRCIAGGIAAPPLAVAVSRSFRHFTCGPLKRRRVVRNPVAFRAEVCHNNIRGYSCHRCRCGTSDY
jgi:hypothetical protein